MNTRFLKLCVTAGLLSALSLTAAAEEKKEVTLKGKGMCGKCELKETSACQNVIQVNYFLEKNNVSDEFHKNVCRSVKKGVSAVGTLKEEGDKKIFVAKKIEVGDLKAEGDQKLLKGEGLCGRCELGETSTCQNVVRVSYFLEPNDISKAFHQNLCSSTAKVKATGTISEKDGKKIFTASKIELDK